MASLPPMLDFPERRVAQKLYIFHPLTQVIKHRCRAVEQRATIGGRLNTFAATIEEAHANCAFSFRDCPRDRGLGGVEALRRLSHAASLNHGREDVEVLQLELVARQIPKSPYPTHLNIDMTTCNNSIRILWHHQIFRG